MANSTFKCFLFNKIYDDRPVVGVCGEDDVAGEDDHQLGEGKVHQQPVHRGPELQQEATIEVIFVVLLTPFSAQNLTPKNTLMQDFIHQKNIKTR